MALGQGQCDRRKAASVPGCRPVLSQRLHVHGRPIALVCSESIRWVLGIDALADEGARRWRAGAAEGGLDALAGRSRVHEAAALTDPAGLGAHRVAILRR